MHKVFLKITVLAALCGFPVLSCAQPPETVRIERLAGLAKLWGAVKYFHPYVAERDIDWDAALVQTISKVESANSTEDYRQAIDNMLSFLHDPNTHTVKEFPSRKIGVAAAAEHPKPYIKWVDEQTALIVATDYAHFLGSFGKGGRSCQGIRGSQQSQDNHSRCAQPKRGRRYDVLVFHGISKSDPGVARPGCDCHVFPHADVFRISNARGWV
jgi:hypothetical protein